MLFADGRRSYFPTRVPRTVKFDVDDQDGDDAYARLYSPATVDAIAGLTLPRYGLGNYVASRPRQPPSPAEPRVLAHLSRAGKRLMGFCRTNLFKRLESGGPAFILSIERHVLRNFVFLHAIQNGLPAPLGTQDAEQPEPSGARALHELATVHSQPLDGAERAAYPPLLSLAASPLSNPHGRSVSVGIGPAVRSGVGLRPILQVCVKETLARCDSMGTGTLPSCPAWRCSRLKLLLRDRPLGLRPRRNHAD